MSIVRQEVFIQREAEIRAAYLRDQERLRELSERHLGALQELARCVPAIEGLEEMLESIRARHEEILARFSYAGYREWAFREGYRLRTSWYGYAGQSGMEPARGESAAYLASFVSELQGAGKQAGRFLRLLREADLEDAESLRALLKEVPSGATRLEKALRERLEDITRKHLQEKLHALYRSVEALNPVAAARHKALLEKASGKAPLKQLESACAELEALLAREKVAAPLRQQAQNTYEALQTLSPKHAAPYAPQIAALPEINNPSELNGLIKKLHDALLQAQYELSEISRNKAVAQELLQRLSALSRETLSALQELQMRVEQADDLDQLREIVKTLAYHLLKQERLATSQQEESKDVETDLEKYRKRGALYYEKLTRLDAAQAREAQPLYEEIQKTKDSYRARLLKDELQYRYLTAREAHLEGEELKERVAAAYAAFPAESLREEVEAFLAQAQVNREAAHALLQKILTTGTRQMPPSPELRARAEKELVDRLTEALRAKGYQLLSDERSDQLLNGEMVELRTPYGPDYAIRLRLENGMLNMRFIRYVEDESQLSEYERQKDKAIGHKWCQDYDNIRSILEANGIYLHTAYRVEADEKFYYVRRSESPAPSRQAGQVLQAQRKKSS